MVFLMYHELELPGRTMCRSEAGYVRYVLSASAFREQMLFLRNGGWEGVNVTQALKLPDQHAVAITFDDGCETDLLSAAPILQYFNFNATFFITCGFIGTRGYLTTQQLKELSAMGFEIGCHSMTHAYLPDLEDAALRREVIESKILLEQLLGKPIDHFSCPGGRFDHRVKEFAHNAGYRSVSTSRTRNNSKSTNPFALGRVAVMRDTGPRQFNAYCHGEGLWQMNLRDGARRSVMRILGNSLYDRVRGTVLGE